MLVLSRFKGQKVVIGNPRRPLGTIKVTQVRGGEVRIAFDFPRDVPVHRGEIAEAVLAGAVDQKAVPA